jgi:hypothetical protein
MTVRERAEVVAVRLDVDADRLSFAKTPSNRHRGYPDLAPAARR